MNTAKHKILIIDDHPIILDGLKTLLSNEDDLEIAATAQSGKEATELLQQNEIDLAIVDLSLGDSDGSYLIQHLHSRYPNLHLLVYSMSEEKLFAERVSNAGAGGYVMKTSSPAVLKEAIRTVLNGDLYFSPAIKKRIQRRMLGKPCEPRSELDNLSNREMDIFRLVGEGLSSAVIAQRLNISRNTVDTHRINIKNKLNLKNSKELEHLAYSATQQRGSSTPALQES